ncbi:dUTP diphosphatase [Bacillus sp. V5-8f]|nr:dUTP diphosphatase [Bacillus sp. V5-8f]
MEDINVGGMLGFSASQVEAAYLQKNKVNFQRQEQGF